MDEMLELAKSRNDKTIRIKTIANHQEQEPHKELIKDNPTGYLEIFDHCLTDPVEEVFGDLLRDQDYKTMANRVVFTASDEKANEYNSRIFDQVQDNGMKVYKSTDKSNGQPEYPIDFLNTLQSAGLPPHELKLKENVPVVCHTSTLIKLPSLGAAHGLQPEGRPCQGHSILGQEARS